MADFFEDGGTWRRIAEDGRLLVFERTDGRPDDAREIRLCGVFDDTGQLAVTLNLIQMAKLDGALHVSTTNERVVLYFRQGSFLSGRSQAPGDKFGEILLRGGKISETQLREALGEKDKRSMLGNVLVRKRLMTIQEVYAALQEQARCIMGTALRFARGTYSLIAPLDMTAVPAMLHLNTQNVLLAVLRDIDEEKAQAMLEPAPEDMERVAGARAAKELTNAGAGQLIDTYCTALRRLFAAVNDDAVAGLIAETETLLHDSATPFYEIFEGVRVQADGSLDKDRLIANLVTNQDRGSEHLQVGLSELLFFVLFAAGDAVDARAKAALHREVAEAMRGLP